jgi:hypothetical protein
MPNHNADIKWMDQPEDHRYEAASSYLSLVFDEPTVRSYVEGLRRAPITHFLAKDIFRSSGLSLLGISNSHVKRDQAKIEAGTPLSPLLLVRDAAHGKVIVADGYHRLCAVYTFNEDAEIPCKIV